ncbi:MAG: cytochrome c [Pseudomonadota bacterium]|nr:cytochrome c [Pseudomonadota bacterium]
MMLLAVGLVSGIAGCERTFRDMYDQPRYRPLAPSTLWPDGRSSRPSVEGTVSRSVGTFAGTSSGRLGVEASDEPSAEQPAGGADRAPPRVAVLHRGQERFDIFCAPCHSRLGDGDGMIVRRGFPAPPSYHIDRLRTADDRHFFDVISNGYGAMYAYANRIPVQDRWAIVAYIRALQRSQHASLADLPADARTDLEAKP